MLIITRRGGDAFHDGEKLVIGDHVIITVLGIKGNQVRLGISAPRDVSVHREEIYTRLKKEQKDPNEPVEAFSNRSAG